MHFKNAIFVCCWIGWCELSNGAKLIVMKMKINMITLNIYAKHVYDHEFFCPFFLKSTWTAC